MRVQMGTHSLYLLHYYYYYYTLLSILFIHRIVCPETNIQSPYDSGDKKNIEADKSTHRQTAHHGLRRCRQSAV